ncbi:ArsR/SmtB family transcription factor [Compostimonas suwonensis]|uniref:DNA-binding transcriptional ArsR family regulator n=1 Tax=Compostimonas suwonensis TaxID=1048394 RepID=A0A2M9C4Y2_9MICO|nr:metalloregulator ArsR/SmtB family transcription factor [Compostimonas suwonensis]PJJ65585.1 DNA-binding transcriptional ArsR family regulator [Compostimonas suwonensis]
MATDTLSLTFSALADPTRRAILARLADGEATVTELAEPFEISLPAISRHLKVLETSGLISRGRSAQWRTSRLEPAPLAEVNAYLETYRRFLGSSFDRLAEHLRRVQEESGHPLDDTHGDRTADTTRTTTPTRTTDTDEDER